MERRSALRELFSVGSRNVAGLVGENCLGSSDQREVKAICHALSSLYGRKLSAANLRKGGASVASYALSPLGGVNSSVGTPTPTQPSLQQYEIAKIGRREFLVIGGAVVATAVGSTLYYAGPGARTLTETLTETLTKSTTSNITLTETETTLMRTTATETTERTTTRTTTRTITRYQMTVSTVWYNCFVGQGEGFEMYFETARRGKIADVRKELESEGTAYFQKAFYDQFGRRVPRRKLRVGFEHEEPVTRVQNNILVQATSMEYYGGRWNSTPMSQRLLSCA
jgi:hypothetical protein